MESIQNSGWVPHISTAAKIKKKNTLKHFKEGFLEYPKSEKLEIFYNKAGKLHRILKQIYERKYHKTLKHYKKYILN